MGKQQITLRDTNDISNAKFISISPHASTTGYSCEELNLTRKKRVHYYCNIPFVFDDTEMLEKVVFPFVNLKCNAVTLCLCVVH